MCQHQHIITLINPMNQSLIFESFHVFPMSTMVQSFHGKALGPSRLAWMHLILLPFTISSSFSPIFTSCLNLPCTVSYLVNTCITGCKITGRFESGARSLTSSFDSCGVVLGLAGLQWAWFSSYRAVALTSNSPHCVATW